MSRDTIFSDRDLADFLKEADAPERLQKQAIDWSHPIDALGDAASSVGAEAQNAYQQVDQSLGGYGKTLIGGLAGAAAGGGALYMGSSRRENETKEEFEARRRQNAVTGAIGGGAVGGAVPTVAGMFGGGKEPGVLGKAWDYMNPMHNRGTGAVTGAGAGAFAGGAATGTVAGFVDKRMATDANKSPLFQQENSLPNALAAAEQSNKLNPSLGAQKQQAGLLDLQSALRSKAERARLFPNPGDFEREFERLGVARRGRGRGIVGTGAGIGALLGGVYMGNHAATESD